MKINYIKYLLETNERTPTWLSRKIGISHTQVFNWLKGNQPIKSNHFEKAVSVLGGSVKEYLTKGDSK